MRCLFVTVFACAAIVSTSSTPLEHANTEDIPDEATEEYTTVESSSALEIAGNSAAAIGTSSDFQASRMRRCNGEGVREVTEEEYNTTYPFVVSLYYENYDYACTGSILTPRLILTAAHCCEDKEGKGDVVSRAVANSRDIRKGGNEYKIERCITYADSVDHDIAILLLNASISNAHPVPLLPPETKVFGKQELLALGWGRMQNEYWPRNLMMVNLTISNREKCDRLYGKDKNWICTETFKSSTCQGDSGGPLLYKGMQVGITSQGVASIKFDCGNGKPTRNVLLKEYWKWIQSYVDVDSSHA